MTNAQRPSRWLAAGTIICAALVAARALGGMIVVMKMRGVASDLGPAIGMAIASAVDAVALGRLLGSLTAARTSASPERRSMTSGEAA